MTCRKSTLLAFVVAWFAGPLAAQEGQTRAVAAPGPRRPIHALILHDFADGLRPRLRPRTRVDTEGLVLACRRGRDASYLSPEIAAPIVFDGLLPSWNVKLPEQGDAGFRVDLQVQGMDGVWSPWLYFGGWGRRPAGQKKIVRWKSGRVAVDDLKGKLRFRRTRYRIMAWGAGDIHLRRFALCFSDTSGKARKKTPRRQQVLDRKSWARRLPVPYISQKIDDPAMAHRLCSPTSVAMVLDYRGVTRDKATVARRLFDSEHDLYGNWNHAVQGAFTFGVPGYLTRFSDWDEVRAMISRAQPLIISIKAKKGQLKGSPYSMTDGHLLVLCGFDGAGGVLVNDPGARDARHGQLTYALTDLDRVWLDQGGCAYVLLPRS